MSGIERLKEQFKRLPYGVCRLLMKIKSIYKRTVIWSRGGAIQIPFMVIGVGQACNFKCRDCGNLAPYAPQDCRTYPVEQIMQDFDILSEYISYIETIQIQGGEPFLYKDLTLLIKHLGEYKAQGKVGNITIATNGSLLPPDQVLNMLKEYKGQIRISDYGIACEQAEKLKQRCQTVGVTFQTYEFASGQSMWYDLGGISLQRENRNNVAGKRFLNCAFRGCLTLEHGELAYCSRAVNSFAILNFTRKSNDYLRISKGKNFRRKLLAYLTDRHFMEACRYCNGTDKQKKVFPAVQMGK